MHDEKIKECYGRLGLGPEACLEEVEQAFRELRKLYSEESLATYSLLDEFERDEKNASLQEAYDQIKQFRQQPSNILPRAKPFPQAGPEPDQHRVQIDVDPQEKPGLFLQKMREARGLTLKAIASRTKIRSFYLQSIEEQRFEELPPPVYLRGFLRQVARIVGVSDVESLIDNYLKRSRGAK